VLPSRIRVQESLAGKLIRCKTCGEDSASATQSRPTATTMTTAAPPSAKAVVNLVPLLVVGGRPLSVSRRRRVVVYLATRVGPSQPPDAVMPSCRPKGYANAIQPDITIMPHFRPRAVGRPSARGPMLLALSKPGVRRSVSSTAGLSG